MSAFRSALVACVVVFGFALPASAQPLTFAPAPAHQLRIDVLHADDGVADGGRRDVLVAGALSAAVPGLGQAYNRHWVKAALAVAIEASVIVAYQTWRAQGLDGRDDYEAFAHADWAPDQYAAWLNDYKAYLGEIGQKDIQVADVMIVRDADFEGGSWSEPDAWTAADRRAVRVMFDQIRALERESETTGRTQVGFSHVLPYFGEQQYYELVGKYFQFAPGWSDYPDWGEPGAFNAFINPSVTDEQGRGLHTTPLFRAYARDHQDANTLLRRASRVTGFLVANHLVAAIDAAVSARLKSRRVSADVSFGPDGLGRLETFARLRVRL